MIHQQVEEMPNLIKLSRKNVEGDWDEDLLVTVNRDGYVLVITPINGQAWGCERTFFETMNNGEFISVKNKRYFVEIDKKHKFFRYAKFQEDFKKCGNNMDKKLLLINVNGLS